MSSSETLIVRYGVGGELATVKISLEANAKEIAPTADPVDIRIITRYLMSAREQKNGYFVCRSTDDRTVAIPAHHVLSIEEAPE